MTKQWKDMNEEEQSQYMEEGIKKSHRIAQRERKMTRNPEGDDFAIVGCDEYCIFPNETSFDFVVQHDLEGGKHLYFCDNPKAERFSDGALKLCMVYGSRQSDENISDVRKGNIRVKRERG